MLEKKLLEEIKRYKEINRYAKNLIIEQEEPPTEEPLPGDAPDAGGEALPGDAPAPDAGGEGLPTDAPAPDMGGDEAQPLPDEGMDGGTEEIDITDLVNMTKSIKKDLEQKTSEPDKVLDRMDDVFSKLTDLEKRISEMDDIIGKIDSLGEKIEKMKQPTPEEKLNMRSLDSYPFNENPKQYFDEKIPEMEKAGKHEYVVTPDDANDYSKETIKDTFNPEQEEDEFKY